MKKAVSMPMHFRRSSGFTLLEVMIAAALVAVAVGGLVRTLDQGLAQTETRRWNANLVGHLDAWTQARLNADFFGSQLAVGTQTETVTLAAETATLQWTVTQALPELKRLEFRLEPADPTRPVVTWQAMRNY